MYKLPFLMLVQFCLLHSTEVYILYSCIQLCALKCIQTYCHFFMYKSQEFNYPFSLKSFVRPKCTQSCSKTALYKMIAVGCSYL